MSVFPLPQGDSETHRLRGRFTVKNGKSLSKVKKTRVLTEKGCFLLLQKKRVYAYFDHKVTLSTVRSILGAYFNRYWGPQKGSNMGLLGISLNIIIWPTRDRFVSFE